MSVPLAAATLDEPKGNLEGDHQQLSIDTNDQLFNAASYANVIVAYRNGAPIRTKDIGTIIDSSQQPRTGAWFHGQRAEVLLVQRQAGANVVQVIQDIKR